MADFPTSVYAPREKQNRSGVVYDPTKKKQNFVEDITKLDDEIVAIETWLETFYNFDEDSIEIAGLIVTDTGYVEELEIGSMIYLPADGLNVSFSKTPASSGAQGVKGTICWDTSYIYVCVNTNTWKRVAISTW